MLLSAGLAPTPTPPPAWPPSCSTRPGQPATCYAAQIVPSCSGNGDVELPFGTAAYVGLGATVFFMLVIIELFGCGSGLRTRLSRLSVTSQAPAGWWEVVNGGPSLKFFRLVWNHSKGSPSHSGVGSVPTPASKPLQASHRRCTCPSDADAHSTFPCRACSRTWSVGLSDEWRCVGSFRCHAGLPSCATLRWPSRCCSATSSPGSRGTTATST